MTAAYLLGSVMLAPVALTQPLRWAGTFSGLALVVYLGVVTMGLGNVFATVGLRSIGPGPAATLLLTDPLTATALALLMLGENLTPPGAAGLTTGSGNGGPWQPPTASPWGAEPMTRVERRRPGRVVGQAVGHETRSPGFSVL